MRAFEFDASVLAEYAAFSRSFTRVRADDLAVKIDGHYADGHFWPAPLLSLNPAYERGPTIAVLEQGGVLTSDTASVFRAPGAPLQLHRHQGEAVAKSMGGGFLKNGVFIQKR